MKDLRLVNARQLLWDKDAWREPAWLVFVIQGLKQIIDDNEESTEARAEAEMLIKKLYMAGKKPAGAI